jgi:hypothetical protein
MRSWILAHPFGADDIVYLAEHGSQAADMALREIIAERTDRNESLGAVLGAYNIRLLNPHRLNHPGPAKAENFVRDVTITALVMELMDRYTTTALF